MAAEAIQETTQILAQFAAKLSYDALPERAREHAKKLLLDALACAVAGHQGEETGQMAALASALAESSESSVIGGGHLSLAGATLLNGYLITAVTMCDAHRATMTHITPEVVPPALAIAELVSLQKLLGDANSYMMGTRTGWVLKWLRESFCLHGDTSRSTVTCILMQ